MINSAVSLELKRQHKTRSPQVRYLLQEAHNLSHHNAL